MPSGPLSGDVFLRVVRLSKQYTVRDRTIRALDKVSFSLPAGRSLAVTGYSGSGKSTLLGLVGGLDRPTAGEVVLDGIPYSALNEQSLTSLRRRRIGFVFQTFNLFPSLTAFENVFLSARIGGAPRAEARHRSEELLAKVGMRERAGHRPSQLSGGEQQRVAIARALVFRPALLLADEPTGDLDSENAAVVADLIFGLCLEHGSSCVYATHNLGLAERADARLTMKDGRATDGGDWGSATCSRG